ncbi:hypothetical protein pb186bvf_009927 [Paramecium bursaria]
MLESRKIIQSFNINEEFYQFMNKFEQKSRFKQIIFDFLLYQKLFDTLNFASQIKEFNNYINQCSKFKKLGTPKKHKAKGMLRNKRAKAIKKARAVAKTRKNRSLQQGNLVDQCLIIGIVAMLAQPVQE